MAKKGKKSKKGKKKSKRKSNKKSKSKKSKKNLKKSKGKLSKEAKKAAPKVPKELKKKLEDIKGKLDKFKKQVLDKFDEYIVGIALLPPKKDEKGKKKDEINVLVLVDDSDVKKMTYKELKQKLTAIIGKIAKDVDKRIKPDSLLLSELWQSCYDGKYDILELIARGAPIHDTGMLSAIKVAEVHKKMILKKFEKYIVSYVLAGSLVQGKATPTSDIDVWVVIDDTDVKKMTRAELKDKLRAIIIGMGAQAGEVTGVKNKLNVQVYILTDFWNSLKEANPIIFTLLRDGVPFYDRGMFMPWKQLLKMGKIKPSREAIDKFMDTGDKMLKRVKKKIRNIGMEDTFYAILTPSQAALMMYGVPPPTPKETPKVMKEIFVEKEGLLEEKYVKILENNIDVRKKIEHGKKKKLTGKEVDKLIEDAEDYLKRIKKLFESIEEVKEEESIVKLYDKIITIIRDVLKAEGIEKAKDREVVKLFEDELISSGKIPAKYLRDLNEIVEAKEEYEKGELSKAEIEKAKKGSQRLVKFLIEYLQRKRGREIERTKIRVKHGDKFGEVILLGKTAFIIHDIDAEEERVSKAPIKDDGSLGIVEDSSLEELEKALAKIDIPKKAFIKGPIFEDLEKVFGKDVEVLVSY